MWVGVTGSCRRISEQQEELWVGEQRKAKIRQDIPTQVRWEMKLGLLDLHFIFCLTNSCETYQQDISLFLSHPTTFLTVILKRLFLVVRISWQVTLSGSKQSKSSMFTSFAVCWWKDHGKVWSFSGVNNHRVSEIFTDDRQPLTSLWPLGRESAILIPNSSYLFSSSVFSSFHSLPI